jgi:hypothetical protein
VKECLIGGGELKTQGLALKAAQDLVYRLLKQLLVPTVATPKC